MRLIFVPQYPTKLRYPEWWITKFPEQFQKYFDEVIVLGSSILKEFEDEHRDKEMFSSIDNSILFECEQIKEYLNLKKKEDDILFLADLSFAGIFSNVLYHYPVKKMYAFCHATSLNYLDYFQNVRLSKWLTEAGHARMFEKVFIGSKYHEEKLRNTGYFKNTVVTYLPKPPFLNMFELLQRETKIHNIVSASRPTSQKVDLEIENSIEEIFGKIERTEANNWFSYYRTLAQSKVLICTSKEETFGYQIVDAILSGCIPICPNKLSYPELLSTDYLYNNYNDLVKTLMNIFKNGKEVPILLCDKEMDNFYENICGIMKGK